MRAPDTSQRPPADRDPFVTGGVVTHPRRCITCSYNLQGLPADALCPECGTRVALSLRDNLLINSAPAYLATIHKGVFLIQAAIIIMILGFIVMILGVAVLGVLGPGAGALPNPGALAMIVTIGAAALTVVPAFIGLYGWYMFSEPDPRASETDRGEKPRRIVRATAVVEAVLMIAAQGGSVLVQLIGTGAAPLPAGGGGVAAPAVGLGLAIVVVLLGVAAYSAMAVRFFASMLYIRWMAPRVPNEKTFHRAKLLMWLGPLLCTVGVLACYLGPLVALVLYYNLLEWMRLDIKRIRAVAERGATPPEQNPSLTPPA